MRPNLDFSHTPTRGSEVEKWIQRARDSYQRNEHGKPWLALDALLDDYRLRADTGLDLDGDLAEAGE